MMADNDEFIRVTNKDIYRELKEMRSLIESVHAHAAKTNGRVTKLEKESFGAYMHREPIKFMIIMLVIVALVVGITYAPDKVFPLLLSVK